MRKTYKSSNVRFCMEDENQRRTWEYLQSLTRKDIAHGKTLPDAFVLVLDGKVPKGDAEAAEEPCFSLLKAKKALSEENIPIGKKLSEEAFYAGLKVTAEHIEESVADRISKMQEALLRQLTKKIEEHAIRTVSGEDTLHREQCEEETEQVPETDMSDAMMSMALAMGE